MFAEGKQAYLDSQQKDWNLDGKPCGWIKGDGLLKYATVFQAGHGVTSDQPECAYDLISKFINDDLI